MGATLELLYAAMREIDAQSMKYEHEHRRLSPPYGSVAVGGAHMDPFFRAEGLRGFLRGLRDKKSPEEAEQMGCEAGAFAINKWNNSRLDYVVHRWEKSVDSVVRSARQKIEAILQ